MTDMSTAAREEAERWIKDHYEDRRREAARSGGIIARDTLAHDAFIAGWEARDAQVAELCKRLTCGCACHDEADAAIKARALSPGEEGSE